MNILLINTPAPKGFNRCMAGGMGFQCGDGVVLPPLDLLSLATELKAENHNVKLIDGIVKAHWQLGDYINFCNDNTIEKIYTNYSFSTQEADNQFAMALEKCLPNIEIVANFKYAGNSTHDYSLINPYPYRYFPLGEKKVATMRTSKGCPHDCYYCPYPLSQGTTWMAWTAETIFAQMQDVKRRGFESVLFRDADFCLDYKRIVRLCQIIKHNDFKLDWWCETKACNLSSDLMMMMHEAGCKGINIGVETLSPIYMEMAKRNTSIDWLKYINNESRKIGIKLHFMFICGLDYESVETIMDTANGIIDLRPYSCGISAVTPYTGTELYMIGVRGHLLSDLPLTAYDGTNICMRSQYMTIKELKFGRFLLMVASYVSKRNSLVRFAFKAFLKVLYPFWKIYNLLEILLKIK